MPKLTIDGEEFEAPAGTTVLQAALSRGIEIPHYCYHPALSLTGNCRSVDVTPDNTVLSTQLADLNLRVRNSGAVRDGSSRGWLGVLLDKIKPF